MTLRGVMTPGTVGVMTPTMNDRQKAAARSVLQDVLPRALYSEYTEPGAGNWHALPEKAKNQWRRVAAYVERLTEDEGGY